LHQTLSFSSHYFWKTSFCPIFNTDSDINHLKKQWIILEGSQGFWCSTKSYFSNWATVNSFASWFFEWTLKIDSIFSTIQMLNFNFILTQKNVFRDQFLFYGFLFLNCQLVHKPVGLGVRRETIFPLSLETRVILFLNRRRLALHLWPQ